jgi:hypothetical protein
VFVSGLYPSFKLLLYADFNLSLILILDSVPHSGIATPHLIGKQHNSIQDTELDEK